jgi:AP-1 complex subunit gamma-1
MCVYGLQISFPHPNVAHQSSLLDLSDDPVAPPINGQDSATQNTQSLLADIFGGSTSTTNTAQQAHKSAVDDILSLFGSSPTTTPSSSTSTPAPAATSPLDLLGGMTPQTAPPQSQPAKPSAPSYAAYDKNGLKISFTPQVSAAKPGMVNVVVKFSVTGSEPATNLNFQAAVPKVSVLES